jgi:hypothetical protein
MVRRQGGFGPFGTYEVNLRTHPGVSLKNPVIREETNEFSRNRKATKSAPNIALEAMLDLPPLPALVKKEAAQAAFRLLDS